MRLAVELTPQDQMYWKPSDQYKLHGRLWNDLEGTKYETLHDDSKTPTFCFSNIFPTNKKTHHEQVLNPQDNCLLFISSPHPGLLDSLSASFDQNRTLHIGDNRFTVTDVQSRDEDIGRVGSAGTLKTQTGVYLRLPQEKQKEYNIETPYENSTISWTPDMGYTAFRERLLENARYKTNQLCLKTSSHPQEFSDLFTSTEILTTFEADVNVTQDYTFKFFPSIVELEYTVTSEDQRMWLNTLLDTGLGWKNALGFGFLNKQ